MWDPESWGVWELCGVEVRTSGPENLRAHTSPPRGSGLMFLARRMIQGGMGKGATFEVCGLLAWSTNLHGLQFLQFGSERGCCSLLPCPLVEPERTPLPSSQTGLQEAGFIATMSLKGETEHWGGMRREAGSSLKGSQGLGGCGLGRTRPGRARWRGGGR